MGDEAGVGCGAPSPSSTVIDRNGGPDAMPRAVARVARSESARAVLDHVTSRWGVEVLAALSAGACRWGALVRGLDGVSEKMLASTLKKLECDGMVRREVLSLSPPHVEYDLTADGREVLRRLLPLVRWVADREPASME